jgi:putative oxidoreductase
MLASSSAFSRLAFVPSERTIFNYCPEVRVLDQGNRLDAARPRVLSVFRMVVSFLFACHGASSVLGVFGGSAGGHGPAVGAWPGWWAGLIQLIGGIVVFFGVVTVPVALLNSGSMAYAYFTVHQKNALLPIQNNGEPAVMFCWAFLLIAVLGPGAWSLGGLIRKATTRTQAGPAPAADPEPERAGVR